MLLQALPEEKAPIRPMQVVVIAVDLINRLRACPSELPCRYFRYPEAAAPRLKDCGGPAILKTHALRNGALSPQALPSVSVRRLYCLHVLL